MTSRQYLKRLSTVIVAAITVTTQAETGQEIRPIRITWPGTAMTDFKTTGHWTASGDIIAASGHGTETLSPQKYSALKNITVETIFDFKGTNHQGAAGIRVGFSIADHICWTYLYFPAEKKLKVEYRYKDTVRLLKSFDRQLKPPYVLRVEHKSGGNTCLWANGEKLFENRNVFGGIPVFHNSGVIAINAPIEVKKLELSCGDYLRPAIALGDSITHHCQWQRYVTQTTGVPITNAGMAGEDSGMTRRRFASDVLALHPKLLFIFIGTNDSNPTAALENVKAMTEAATQAGIPVVLCTLIPRAALPKIDIFNQGLKSYAAAHNLPLLDWNPVLDDGTKRISKEYGGEVHPNAAGAKRMAEFLCSQPKIRQMLDTLKSPTTSN